MKLKQKFALGLCVFYLISVIGVALSLHFCGAELRSVKFTRVPVCKACKAAEKKDGASMPGSKCCKNSAVDARIKDSHESGTKVSIPKNYSIELFLTSFLAEIFQSVVPHLFGQLENKAPPLSARLALYVYHCVFRI